MMWSVLRVAAIVIAAAAFGFAGCQSDPIRA
ncbi:hypothetical protein BH18CHL2_BH18CHL2_13120 [soil metagenome]